MDICEYCKEGELELVPAVEPYSAECYICPVCDSTYDVEYYIAIEPD